MKMKPLLSQPIHKFLIVLVNELECLVSNDQFETALEKITFLKDEYLKNNGRDFKKYFLGSDYHIIEQAFSQCYSLIKEAFCSCETSIQTDNLASSIVIDDDSYLDKIESSITEQQLEELKKIEEAQKNNLKKLDHLRTKNKNDLIKLIKSLLKYAHYINFLHHTQDNNSSPHFTAVSFKSSSNKKNNLLFFANTTLGKCREQQDKYNINLQRRKIPHEFVSTPLDFSTVVDALDCFFKHFSLEEIVTEFCENFEPIDNNKVVKEVTAKTEYSFALDDIQKMVELINEYKSDYAGLIGLPNNKVVDNTSTMSP